MSIEPARDEIEAAPKAPPMESIEMVTDPMAFDKPIIDVRRERFQEDAFTANPGEVDFRNMSWVSAALISTAENIALGILSFPSIYRRLGLVGGLLSTWGLGALAYATGWIMVDFKMKYMGVMNVGDAGDLMFGRWGRYLFGWGLVLKAGALAGSHVLAGEQALRSLSREATCGVAFAVAYTVASVMASWSRQWHGLSKLAIVSLICILASSYITVIGVSLEPDANLEAKAGGPIEWSAWPANPNLVDVIGALTNIVTGYGGNMAVFTFCSEMRNPNDFKKSFAVNQISGIVTYSIVGSIIYTQAGQIVPSPAFSLLNYPLMDIAYSLALVCILISGLLAANIGAKYAYVASLRGSPLLTSNAWRSQFIWLGIVAAIWVFAFLLSQLIPFFNELLTIVSAVCSVWFTYGISGIIWIWDIAPFARRFAKDPFPRSMNTWGKWVLGFSAVLSIIVSLALCPLGLYSAAEGIKKGYSSGKFSHPFAC